MNKACRIVLTEETLTSKGQVTHRTSEQLTRRTHADVQRTCKLHTARPLAMRPQRWQCPVFPSLTLHIELSHLGVAPTSWTAAVLGFFRVSQCLAGVSQGSSSLSGFPCIFSRKSSGPSYEFLKLLPELLACFWMPELLRCVELSNPPCAECCVVH